MSLPGTKMAQVGGAFKFGRGTKMAPGGLSNLDAVLKWLRANISTGPKHPGTNVREQISRFLAV